MKDGCGSEVVKKAKCMGTWGKDQAEDCTGASLLTATLEDCRDNELVSKFSPPWVRCPRD